MLGRHKVLFYGPARGIGSISSSGAHRADLVVSHHNLHSTVTAPATRTSRTRTSRPRHQQISVLQQPALGIATLHSRSVGVIQDTCGDQADWLEAQLFNASFEDHASVGAGGPDGPYYRRASHYNGCPKAVTFDYDFSI